MKAPVVMCGASATLAFIRSVSFINYGMFFKVPMFLRFDAFSDELLTSMGIHECVMASFEYQFDVSLKVIRSISLHLANILF